MIMHFVKSSTAAGRFRRLIVPICLLLFFLNGCASLQSKKVAPPPSRPTASSKPPAEVLAPPVKSPRPSVAKPPVKDRPVVIRPPGAERPVVNKPPVEERPILAEPPVQERPIVTEPPIVERPLVIEPPVEEHPLVIEPPVEERPAVEPPVEERPAMTEPVGDYKPITGRAAGIYNEAEEAMQAGRFAPAEMLLERALRIEPRNAHYWYTLGLAKFRQKQYPQAVQFCLKAESLAGSQPGLLARNQVLLAKAKKAAGMQ